MPLRTGACDTDTHSDYAVSDRRSDRAQFAGSRARDGAFLPGIITRVAATGRPIGSAVLLGLIVSEPSSICVELQFFRLDRAWVKSGRPVMIDIVLTNHRLDLGCTAASARWVGPHPEPRPGTWITSRLLSNRSTSTPSTPISTRSGWSTSIPPSSSSVPKASAPAICVKDPDGNTVE